MLVQFISVTIITLLPVIIFNNCCEQTDEVVRYRIMFYNVENLFDTVNDSLTDDDDFLPEGIMRWNYSRYLKKINSLYRTIIAAGEWEPPPVIAMCEVENKKVLNDLIFNTYLSDYKYDIIHEDSPDQRGIDVCLIYNREKLSLISYRYLKPSLKDNKDFRSRSVLYAKFLLKYDTIHILVNHWPSRRGGVLAGADLRNIISGMVTGFCDSITASCNGKIILCGDFNSAPYDTELSFLTGNSSASLINLSGRLSAKGTGTYRYRGHWEMLDQFIVSESLLSGDAGLFTSFENIEILNETFLLEKDPVYPGYTPFSTYKGYRYHGGFSDHLPVLLDLFIR